MHYSETWDLDSIFAGGIDSPALTAKMSTIKQQLTTTADTLVHWRAAADTPDADWFTQLVNSLQAIQAGIDQATVFVVAYQSAHADDTKAAPLLNQIYQLDNQLNNLLTRFKKQLVKLDQATFDTLVQQPALQAIAFNLTEMRQQGLALLDDDTEALINDLALDGFQGWSDHYDTLVSQIQVPYTDENGITQQLSAGQAQNMLAAAMPNAQRAELMRNWEHAWQTHAAPFADTLNHLAGFRLANYRAHGTTNFLQKPLELNRMSQATLDTMYQVVADASVKAADDAKTKLTLLDAKMQNPLAMFLDIRARFLFETRFYAARQHGIVTPDTLSDLMLTAQKDAYGNALNTYHPMFWASKLHFYIDDVPFYNFPYTFGYLFSLGIYAQAKTQSDFEDRYIALLRDTANMSTEALAAKHLGVDLTKPAFWQAGVALIKRDIDEFMALSAPLI